jgi:dethiobiotin synthetase
MHVFITGTDTDIGKTMVTACLALHHLHQGRRVAIYKPVQTGVSAFAEGDAAQCQLWLNHAVNLHVETTYMFQEPVAPTLADTKGTISIKRVHQRFQELCQSHDVVLVEGAGGILCPLTRQHTMADLIAHLALPAVVVARRTLGTLNHTLCAVEALTHRGVSVASVVLHDATPLPEAVANSLAVIGLETELRQWLPFDMPLVFLPWLNQPEPLNIV